MRTNKSEKIRDRQMRLFKETNSKAKKRGIKEQDVTSPIHARKKIKDV